MKGTIRLDNSIMINGTSVSELSYDDSLISIDMFGLASKKSEEITLKYHVRAAGAMETDNVFHLYLGFASIIAVNPNIDITDLERITGRDTIQIAKVGRAFTIRSAEVDADLAESTDSDTEISTGQSETTEELSTED